MLYLTVAFLRAELIEEVVCSAPNCKKIYDEKIEPTTNFSFLESGSENISVQHMSFAHYQYKKVRFRLDQLGDGSCILQDIQENYVIKFRENLYGKG